MATTSSETETALPPLPGIYHISVATSGGFLHQRLTDGIHLTIARPSDHPDLKQEWQVSRGSKPGTITIARPGNIRPALSITISGIRAHPKPGDKLVLRREEFPTDWFPVPAGPHQYFIRVPTVHPEPKTLGFAVAPEFIHPPFLEIDLKEQLKWAFHYLRPHNVLLDGSEEAEY